MATPTRKKIKPARAHATSAKAAHGGSSFFGSYLTQSRAPLTILVFLLPLLISYEILLALALRSADGVVVTNEAHRWILSLFGAFELGAVGLWLPGVLVVAILLIWHSVERRPWKVEGAVVGLMWSESIVLALPLLVFSQAALRIPQSAVAGVEFDSLSLGGKIAVSVGAGIYEELLFRLGLIGVLLMVFEDALKTSRAVGTSIAIGLSALAFMGYHSLRDASGSVLPSRVVFFLGAGVYFGVLYVARGFGIAVGAHAFYDMGSAIFAAVASPSASADS